MLRIVLLIILVIIINELIQGIIRQKQRNIVYNMAVERSKKTNLPLVVIGDPYNGLGSKFYNLFMKGYDCGNITVDINGAKKCPNGINNDILSYLKKQKSNSQILFISCVLEYVDDIEIIIDEIKRVSGSNDNIFIVSVNKYSLSAYFYYGSNYKSKNLIMGPPFYKDINFIRLTK